MIYLLYGGDDFSLGEAIESLKDDVKPAEMRDFNITALQGAEVTFDQLRSTCDTVPFMADRRMVLVDGLLATFEVRSGPRSGGRGVSSRERSLGEWDALADYLPRVPESTELAFADGRLTESNPLLVRIRPLAKTLTFPLPIGPDLRQWIARRAAMREVEIEPRAVQALAENIGRDLRVIDSELQKLALYRWGQVVMLQDVQEMVANVKEANIFAAVDAALEGRSGVAIRMMHQLLDSGRPAGYLITMMARQVRLLLLAKDLKARGVAHTDMGRRLSLSGYPLRKTLEQERRFTGHRLARAYHGILEADLSMKTGETAEQLAVELLVAELGSGA